MPLVGQSKADPSVTELLETIQTIGSFAGLLTAAFTVWDRWLRGRPLAELSATVRRGGTPAEPDIRIINPGPTALLIRNARVSPAGIYAVAKDREPKSIMAAAGAVTVEDAGVLNVLLPPGQELRLAIIDLRNEEDKTVLRWVHFVVYWRKTSSTWLPQAAVVIGTSTRAIEQIAAAAAQRAQVP
jgi:hypothetical protein